MALQAQRTAPFNMAPISPAPLPATMPILQRMTSLARGNLPPSPGISTRMPGMPSAPMPGREDVGGGGLGGLANMISAFGQPDAGLPNPVADSPGTLALKPRGMTPGLTSGGPAIAPAPGMDTAGLLQMIQGLF